MGCTLATSAKINKARDSVRPRNDFDSSIEDSDALEESPIKSKWLMNKHKASEEKKARAIEYRKGMNEQARQNKINAFKKQYGNKQSTKRDRAPAQQDENLSRMVVDTSFEEEVVQHIEGALTNMNRKVEAFPYQISGRIGLRFWGKVIIQDEAFEDQVFKPSLDSIFDARITEKLNQGTLLARWRKRRKRIYRKWKEIVEWKSPEEVYGRSNYCVFATVEAQDVTQGVLGNCYFLASLSAIAENPHRIKQMFHTKTVTESGAYAIKLYVNGEQTDIVIDDKFPYDPRPEKDCWLFSRDTSENEIWVQLIEKAYAKVFGNYEIIEGGKPYQALLNLTGFPSYLVYHAEVQPDLLWKVIQEGARHDQPMVASVNSKALNEHATIKAKGLADHHAYTVLTALTVQDENQEVIKLVKIRNPYGTRSKREWQLDWKDASDRYKQYLSKQLGIDDELDGIFWMRFESFIEFFYYTSICLYQENYQQICLSDTHGPDEHALTKLIIHEDINDMFIIKLQQIHRRFHDGWLEGKYHYAPMQLYLARVDRLDVDTPEDQFEENTEAVKLIDGHRGTNAPLLYIKRSRISAGEYLLFYRVAFKHGNEQTRGQSGMTATASPGSRKSGKAKSRSSQMDDQVDPEDEPEDGFMHPSRKLVLSLHFPAESKLQMQRIETEPNYGKEVFLQMRRHFKRRFEQGLDEEVVDF